LAENKKLRVLVIGAHPDDCELLTGGTASKYTALGHTVRYVSATNGDTGHFAQGGGTLARRRAEEAKAAAAEAGIESVVMDIHNNGFETDITTREIFIRRIREFAPDLIITHRPWDYHPDHRRTSLLVQDSSYAVLIPNVCPLTPVLRKTPVILYTHDNFKKPVEFSADVVINIDDALESKINIASRHVSQLCEWLPWVDGKPGGVPGPEDAAGRRRLAEEKIKTRDKRTADIFRDKLILKYGYEAGARVECAEAFELCEYGARVTDEELQALFPF